MMRVFLEKKKKREEGGEEHSVNLPPGREKSVTDVSTGKKINEIGDEKVTKKKFPFLFVCFFAMQKHLS